ncbi:hypothetical protein [Roseobacter sp. CCS2]|uniref:hypothetical protein n=1 Tax=Roseobacter sp. CCS2 TaxID=391593 RepID=UPI0000F4058A|nr:hypothetical protein [Roseobacter sp. CCS2]EBA11311.1 hypothetical protein RCCS2_01593 [Roseobacter sp. CCS2]
MKRPFIITVLALGIAGPVVAQPFSKSMAECAGLYAFGHDNVQSDDALHLLEYGQAKWMNAAIVQAQGEGVSDPRDYVEAAMTAKYEEWNARGVTAVFTEEFSDWMDYCRSFARAQDIDLNPA